MDEVEALVSIFVKDLLRHAKVHRYASGQERAEIMKEVSESFQRLCGTPNFTNQQRESIKEVIRRIFMPDLPKLGYYDRR